MHDSLVFMLNVGSHIVECCCCCRCLATTKKIDEWNENYPKNNMFFLGNIDYVIRQYFFFLSMLLFTLFSILKTYDCGISVLWRCCISIRRPSKKKKKKTLSTYWSIQFELKISSSTSIFCYLWLMRFSRHSLISLDKEFVWMCRAIQ